METVGKLIAAALICCALSLLLRKQAPELMLALCAVVCALCFLTVLPFFSPVLAFVRRLEEITGLSQAVFAPLFKTAAIGLLSQLAGTLCRDSGQQALGRLREEARQLQGSAAARCKTYVTLSVCTGLAVAVILI